MTDFSKKTDKEIIKALTEIREKLRTLRFNTAGARAANVKERKNLRKEVARMLTALNQRQAQ